jgi:hypothetical protein
VSESVKLKIRLATSLEVGAGDTTTMYSFWNSSGPTSMGKTGYPLLDPATGGPSPVFCDNRLPFLTYSGAYNPTVIGTPSVSAVPYYGVAATTSGTGFYSLNWPVSGLGVDLRGCSGRIVSQEVRIYNTSNEYIAQGTGYLFQPTLGVSKGINSESTFVADATNLYALQGMQVVSCSLANMEEDQYMRALRFPQTDTECNWLPMDYRDIAIAEWPADPNVTNVPWCVFAATEVVPGQTFRIEVHIVLELVDQSYSFATGNTPSIVGPVTPLELARHSGPQLHTAETARANNAASVASAESAVMGPRAAGGFLDFMGTDAKTHVGQMAKEAAGSIVEPAVAAATESAGEIIGEILGGLGAIFGLSRQPSKVISDGPLKETTRFYHPWSKIPSLPNNCPGKPPQRRPASLEPKGKGEGQEPEPITQLRRSMIMQYVFKTECAIVLRTLFVRPTDRYEKYVTDKLLSGKAIPDSLPGTPTNDWMPPGYYSNGGVCVPTDPSLT